jgi:hypothetical protein
MSFYTSIKYYRPGRPPQVTCDQFARFVSALCDTRAFGTDASDLRSLMVRLGDRIKRDRLGILSDSQKCPCDIELEYAPRELQEIIDCLAGDDRSIYRAWVSLGEPINEVTNPIRHSGHPENEEGFCPDALSVGIGPVELAHLDSHRGWLVGWISLDISSQGYLFPWTFREVVEKLEAIPAVQRLMKVCRELWPVPPDPPPPELVEQRRQNADYLWPYDDLEKPMDWYWGLHESG